MIFLAIHERGMWHGLCILEGVAFKKLGVLEYGYCGRRNSSKHNTCNCNVVIQTSFNPLGRHQKIDLLQLSCQTTMLWGVYLRTVLKSRLVWDQPQHTYCNNLDVTTGGIRKPGLRPAMRRHTSRYRSEGFLVLLATRMHLVGLIMLCCFFAVSSLFLLLGCGCGCGCCCCCCCCRCWCCCFFFSHYLQCSKQKSPSHLLRLGDDTQLYYKMMLFFLINAT